MIKFIVLPYKMGSNSARLLSQSLNAKRVYPDRNYRPRDNHVVINWGSSIYPEWFSVQSWSGFIINSPAAVSIASNKIRSFENFTRFGVTHPEWTTSKEAALQWKEEGHTIISRTILNGHSGSGIVVGEVVDAPLYTKYFKRKHEYRVHVFRDNVIDVQQKKRRSDVESNNFVRNHGNGWVFCRGDVTVPIKVLEESIKAVNSLGLDFGAVDVGFNEHYDTACVFEVNTAPGLEGTTLNKYVEAIKRAYYV